MKESSDSSRRLRRGLVGGVAIAGVVLSTLVGTAVPASAADRPGFQLAISPTNGSIGQQYAISVTDATPNTGISVNFQFGSQGQTVSLTTNASGVGNASWIPQFAGGYTAQALSALLGGDSSNTVSGTISAVTTTTTVSVPSTVALNQPVNLTATVRPNGGSYAPTGTVQFALQGGGNIGGPVALNGSTPSTATVSWTPTSLGSVNIVATYSPATVNGVQPAVCNSACTSAAANTVVTNSGSAVGVTVPPLFVGVPSTLTAIVQVPSYAGSVVFTANGSAIGAAAPVNAASTGPNGVATITYTPTAVGNVVIAATWTGNTGQTGTASQTVAVQNATSQDVITVDPNGDPAPWSFTAPNVTPPGNYALAVKTASGAPATLSITGAGCTLAGTTVSVTATSGSCTLNAKTAGGNGFSPGNTNFVLALTNGVQTAQLAAPNSQRIKKGRTITLATASQGETNAGQEVSWAVTQGRANCRLLFPASGAVRLRKTGNGRCTVVGRAPATGSYGPFSISRTYR
ncbi:MAG: Ig-like domain repeat protein [Actinomycetales bacterium]|nr:Ig-like domain repeat protein [Actinomycetales bacterium]